MIVGGGKSDGFLEIAHHNRDSNHEDDIWRVELVIELIEDIYDDEILA